MTIRNLENAFELTADYDEPVDHVDFRFHFEMTRRRFVQVLGAGLLIVVAQPLIADAQQTLPSQRRGGGRGSFGGQGPVPIAARVHIGKDGSITVMTGKVECGQGARAELTQAAAEELRVAVDRINLIMADTSLVPDDGITAGSRTTPATVIAVRQGAAAAREMLARLAAQKFEVNPQSLEIRGGKVVEPASKKELSYADLAADESATKSFAQLVPSDVSVVAVREWKVLGTSVSRPNARALVSGGHDFPSDIKRPGMLFAKILRQPSYGATLTSIDTSPASAAPNVVVKDDQFVGVAAPTSYAAQTALNAIAATAKWETKPHPPSSELFKYLREHAKPAENPFADDLAKSSRQLKQSYEVAYIQHVPMEPRAAVAEWSDDGKLTVWMSSQNPFGCRNEVARAFNMQPESVRMIVPDFGGGFGGKHSAECAIEAARMAREAKRPVSLRWTRAEEFTWAYFRPAGVIDVQAGMDDRDAISSYYQLNINSGQQSVETPYRIDKARGEFARSEPPLRHGSYRALASSANTFARESAMDELAALAGVDPLEFRLKHLEDGRLKDVLEAAAKKFNWSTRAQEKQPNIGTGLACGIDKGSFVAACVVVEVDPSKKAIKLRHVTEAFECGAIINPDNLMRQVRGGIVMGIGGALREEIKFENGKITNASFWEYEVPRFADVPTMDIELLNRTDLPSVGAGETPIIALAPAIANAVYRATGMRIREMPIRLPA